LLEARPASFLDRTLAPASGFERAFDETIETVDYTSTAKFGKSHFFFLAGLKADGCAGGDIQAHAIREGAVKCESAVRLEEVIVAANLDGTVTRVLDEQSNRPAADIRLYRPGRFIKQKLSRLHALSFELHSLVDRGATGRRSLAFGTAGRARSALRWSKPRPPGASVEARQVLSRFRRRAVARLSPFVICPPAARAN
jgi:hypothetical protein